MSGSENLKFHIYKMAVSVDSDNGAKFIVNSLACARVHELNNAWAWSGQQQQKLLYMSAGGLHMATAPTTHRLVRAVATQFSYEKPRGDRPRAK